MNGLPHRVPGLRAPTAIHRALARAGLLLLSVPLHGTLQAQSAQGAGAPPAVVRDAVVPDPVVPDTVVPLAGVRVEVFRRTLAGGVAPFSSGVVDEAALQRGTSGVFLEEALRGLPGVQVQNRFNFAVGERLSVRGFGARAQFGIRGVRLLVDGIPATLPDGQSSLDHLDPASLGRVEVLRGPSSSLYGNGSGGVVLFRSLPPPMSGFRQEIGTTAGSDGLLRLQATTAGSVGGTGYRLSYGTLGYDGFRSDPVAGSGTYGGARRRTIQGQATRPVGNGTLLLTLNTVVLDADNPGSLPASFLEDPDRPAWSGNVRSGTRKRVEQEQVGLSWTGPVGGGEAEIATWWIHRYVDNPIPGSVVEVDRTGGGARGVFRWEEGSGTAGPRLWTAGAEVEIQGDDRLNFRNVNGDRGTRTLDQREEVRAAGAFLQLLAPVSPRLTLMGGIRADRIAFEADDRFPRAGGADASGNRTMGAVSPSLGLTLRLLPTLSVFGNLSSSFESPTTTELANRPEGSGGFNPELDPQRGTGGEVGIRATYGALSLELAGFRTDVSGELIPFEVATDPGRVFFRNAGSSRYSGWELALRTDPDRALAGSMAWTATRARFEDYTVGTRDFSGNRIPGQAPSRLSGSVTGRHAGVSLELRGEWSAAVPTDDANTSEAPEWHTVDLRAGFDPIRIGATRWTPMAGVTNLLDRWYVASVAVNAFGGRYFEPGPGRSFFVGGTVAFER